MHSLHRKALTKAIDALVAGDVLLVTRLDRLARSTRDLLNVLATVSERMGHSSVSTTANIYAHAIRGKDRAAAQIWDSIMQRGRAEKSTGVN